MFEKDYLMRLFTDFMNAINRILNSIDKNDVEGAKIMIDYSYKLLGKSSDHFLNTDIKDIFSSFKELDGTNYLKRVQMLSQLMYYESLISSKSKKKMLKKSILLMEHYTENTKEYSFESNTMLNKMQNELMAGN